MPLRSTGCLKCRQRKIRCSEERPGCRKCVIHGVACPGYKVARKGDAEFHDQTRQIVQRLQAVSAAASSDRDDDGLSGNHPPAFSSSSSSAGAAPLAHLHQEQASPTDTLTFTFAAFDAAASPPNLRRATPVTPLLTLPSPAANRSRLYDTFLRHYVPQDMSPEGRGVWPSNKKLLIQLMSLQDARPSLPHALDALILVQLGSIYRDRRLLQNAIEAYTRSLRSLRVALSKPDSVHDDTILATTCILSSCEFYTEFRVQGQSWISHQRGMQRLVDARGTASILRSSLALLLFFQLTSSSLAMSLLYRKRDPYATDAWSAVERAAAVHDDHSESNRLGLRLPALLERHDLLDLNHAGSIGDLDDLLFDCNEMQMEMRRNLMNLHARDAQDDKSWIALVNIEHFHPFADLIMDKTMTRAFRFPNFETGYIHSSHWLRMYMLRETIRSLHTKRQQLVPGWQPDKKQEVAEREILFYVLSFCRLVPFFLEPHHGATGDMSCFFLLYIAEQYFRAHGHTRWVRWVRHVSERVFTKGLSMPFGVAAPDSSPAMNTYDGPDETSQLAFNKIEFPNAPLLPDVGRSVTPQGTVWMPSRAPSSTPSPTLTNAMGKTHQPG